MKIEVELDEIHEGLFKKALKFENSKYKVFLIDPFAFGEMLLLKGLNRYLSEIEN